MTDLAKDLLVRNELLGLRDIIDRQAKQIKAKDEAIVAYQDEKNRWVVKWNCLYNTLSDIIALDGNHCANLGTAVDYAKQALKHDSSEQEAKDVVIPASLVQQLLWVAEKTPTWVVLDDCEETTLELVRQHLGGRGELRH
jgi:hypothetical protein